MVLIEVCLRFAPAAPKLDLLEACRARRLCQSQACRKLSWEFLMISSRTPEGDPNRCPVCGKPARIEPSTVPMRDAPCPHCGHLLWFSKSEDQHVRIKLSAAEIAQISKMKLPSAKYYEEFLRRVLTALAAPAGAVWLRTKHGNLELESQRNMQQVGLDRSATGRRAHDELLRQACMKGQPGLIYHQSSIGGQPGMPEPGNPPTTFSCSLPSW
jgi:hypothetical protein